MINRSSHQLTRQLAEERRGYTLIELIVATASASVLVVGLTSALFVAGKAMDVDEGASGRRTRADEVLGRVVDEVRMSTRLRTLTATSIQFDVPDRDNDGAHETIAYNWSGTPGDPLTRTLNAGSALTVLTNVRSLDFGRLERTALAQDVTIVPPASWPVYGGIETANEQDVTQLNIPTPAGASTGEILVAGVVLEGNHAPDLYSMGGWNVIAQHNHGNGVTLGIYWKNVYNGDPASHGWGWGGGANALGWIVRVSNQHATTPIHASLCAHDSSETPTCPALVSTVDNCLAIRMGAFEDDEITVDAPGLSGHTPLLMAASGTSVSGGCGYRIWKPQGDIAESWFELTDKKKSCAATVVIAPAE